jgi:predicted dehydrogenase
LDNGWGERTHIPALLGLHEYDVVAVAATSISRANATASAVGIPLAFDSVEELVNHPDVDLVIAADKSPSHVAVVRAAIAAGKNIFSEWPLAMSTSEAIDLRDAAISSGIVHVVGLQGIYASGTRLVRDLIASGRIGEVQAVHAVIREDQTCGRVPGTEGWWPAERTEAHHMTMNGGHLLSVLSEITMDELQWVSSIDANQDRYRTNPEPVLERMPCKAVIAGLFRRGATLSASLTSAPSGQASFRVEVTGSEGTIQIKPASSGSAEGSIIVGEWLVRLTNAKGQQEEPVAAARQCGTYRNAPLASRNVLALYRALATTIFWGGATFPSFETAVYFHQLMDVVECSSQTGARLLTPVAPVRDAEI